MKERFIRWQRRIQKGVSVCLTALFFLIFAISALVLAVALWPKLLINPTTLNFAARLAERQGVVVSWDQVHIGIDNLALLRKRLRLDFDQLCFRVRPIQLRGCSPKVSLSAAASLSGFVPRLIELGPVDIQGLKWKIDQSEEPFFGTLSLRGEKSDRRELNPLVGWNVDLVTDATFPDRSHAELSGHFNLDSIQKKSPKVACRFTGRYSKGKARLGVQAQGFVQPKAVSLKLNAMGSGWLSALPKIEVHSCSVDLDSAALKVDCPALVTAGFIPESLRKMIQPPSELGARIVADLKTGQFPPDFEKPVSGTVSVISEKLVSPFYSVQVSALGDVGGVPADFPKKWKIDTGIKVAVFIDQFEKLVKQVERTNFAIPAPLNVLHGTLQVQAEGKGDLSGGRLPLKVWTRMASKEETLNIDGDGEFSLIRKNDSVLSKLDLDLNMAQVRLALPDLSWETPPQFFPDSRVQRLTAKDLSNLEDEEAQFLYRIKFKSNPKSPIYLKSNLSDQPIPLFLDLTLRDAGPISGTIRVEKFPIEFFRRKAMLDHFEVKLKFPSQESEIDGLVSLEYTDYLIFVRIENTVGKPSLHLTSEPPLTESQLYAVLFFGRPLDQLDDMESSSIGNVRAAVADGMVNLLSLYVLASTPIQSVSYDPSTQIISAKIRLAAGTSLNLGSGSMGGLSSRQGATIGVRKRLSKYWTFETDVGSSDRGGGVVSAYLEWGHRY